MREESNWYTYTASHDFFLTETHIVYAELRRESPQPAAAVHHSRTANPQRQLSRGVQQSMYDSIIVSPNRPLARIESRSSKFSRRLVNYYM